MAGRGQGSEKAPGDRTGSQDQGPSVEPRGWAGVPQDEVGKAGGEGGTLIPPSAIFSLPPSPPGGQAGEWWARARVLGTNVWGALRSPAPAPSQERRHRELGILREEKLYPNSTGKQPAPLASFPLRGLRSPFPA